MPITITKQKEKKVEETKVEVKAVNKTPDTMTDEELADYYGALNDQCEALMNNPVFANFKLAEKELLKRIELAEVPPQDGAEIQGNEWMLEIGACSRNPRKITDIPKIMAFLGQAQFAKLAKVNLSDAEKYLTPDQLKDVITEDTGYGKARKITAKYLGNKG